jgi:hypothetical protein
MSDERIKKRIQSIEVRNSFTDELWSRGIEKTIEFAMITNKTYKIFGDDVNAAEIRAIKGLDKNDNIRDNMTDIEMQLTQMTEVGAKEIMQWEDAQGFAAIGDCVDKSVEIVKETRAKFETIKKNPVLSSQNNLSNQQKEKRKLMKKEKQKLKE